MSNEFKLALTERTFEILSDRHLYDAGQSADYARHLKSEVKRTMGASGRADVTAARKKAECGVALYDLMSAPAAIQVLAGIPEDATKSNAALCKAVADMFPTFGKSADTFENLARLGATCVSLVLTGRCADLEESTTLLSTPEAAKTLTAGLETSKRLKNGQLVDRASGTGRPFLVRHVAAGDPEVLEELDERFLVYLSEVADMNDDHTWVRKADASEHKAAIAANPRKPKTATKLTLEKATERMREAVGAAVDGLSKDDLAKFIAAAKEVIAVCEK